MENESDEDEDLEPIMLQADDIEKPHNVLNGSKVGPVKKLRMTSDSDVQDVKVLKATQGVKRKALPLGAKEGKGSVKCVKTIALPKKSGAKIAPSKGLTINVSRDIHANGGHSLIRNMHYSEGTFQRLCVAQFLDVSMQSVSSLLYSGSDSILVTVVVEHCQQVSQKQQCSLHQFELHKFASFQEVVSYLHCLLISCHLCVLQWKRS